MFCLLYMRNKQEGNNRMESTTTCRRNFNGCECLIDAAIGDFGYRCTRIVRAFHVCNALYSGGFHGIPFSEKILWIIDTYIVFKLNISSTDHV